MGSTPRATAGLRVEEALDQALERFRELGELVLVLDRDLDLARADARPETRRPLERDSDAFGERGIDGRPRLAPRARLGARPARGPLRGAHGHTLLHDLAGEPAAALV